jgi:hypothetical protein
MAQNNNILQELLELESSLASQAPQNVYAVPAGYFEGFAAQMLNRVKALEARNASEELSYLSPVLSSVSKQMPYALPAGYFESVDERLALVMQEDSHQTAKEELGSLSPLLDSLSRKMPYSVPQGYFENLAPATQPAKVVSITHRKWFKYAAAAMITGIIALGTLLFFNYKNRIDPVKQPDKWIAKNIKKIDSKEVDAFVQLAEEEFSNTVATAPVKTEEIKELMKDVSDTELQKFLDEIPEDNTSDDADVMMN